MGLLHFETLSPAGPLVSLPVRIEQSSPGFSTGVALAILVTTALAMASPFAVLLMYLIEDPDARSVLAARPGSVIQLALGLIVWSLLLGWPLKRLVDGWCARRLVSIDHGTVTVTDRNLWSERAWRAPVASYCGIAHHIRASVSGIRHELILVHPDRRRSVLLAVAARLSQEEIDRATALLGRPEIPSRTLYEWQPGGAVPASGPLVSLQA